MKKKLRVNWSVEEMQKGGRRLRFLTLTVAECGLPLQIVAARFRALRNSRYLRDVLKGNQYICVYEKHPNGHGWHIHIVLNFWLDIRTFRGWANRYGFGRIHIELCGKSIGKYIGKYITKTLEERPEDCKGMRLINVSRGLLALRDIVCSSLSIEFVKRNFKRASISGWPPFARLKMLQMTWACRILPQDMCFSLRYFGDEYELEYF